MVPSPTFNHKEMDVRVGRSTFLFIELKDGLAEVVSEVGRCACLSSGAEVGDLWLQRFSSQLEPPVRVSGFIAQHSGKPTEEPDLREQLCCRSGLRACLPYGNL